MLSISVLKHLLFRAIMKNLVTEILQLCVNTARDFQKVYIIIRNLQLAIINDEKLNKFSGVVMKQSGVLENIQSVFSPKKTEKNF